MCGLEAGNRVIGIVDERVKRSFSAIGAIGAGIGMAQTVAKRGINKVVLFFLHIAADRAGGAVVGLIDLRHFAAIDMRQLVPGAASTADLDMLIRVSGRIKGMRKSLLIAALGAGAFMPFVVT